MSITSRYIFFFSLLLCVWGYAPGLDGLFLFDDVENISDNKTLQITQFTPNELWRASLSSNSGPLKRPVSMLSFAINHVLTGLDPWWMKLTNLLIHLVNGFLLLFVCRELFRRLSVMGQEQPDFAAYLIAGIWLIHPINMTSVAYIIQRMTSLSALFTLIALLVYLKLRNANPGNWKQYFYLLSIGICWFLGLLSKENAVLLGLYIAVIEWCLYRFNTERGSINWTLKLLWGILAAPWLIAVVYLLFNPAYLPSTFELREFTAYERVLTEFRILIDYIYLIIAPNITDMGLYHDDYVLSRSLIEPIGTLLSLVVIVCLLGIAIFIRKKYPLAALGILWFFAGHLLESSILSLELFYLHRNYLPSIGILFVGAELGKWLYLRYSRLTICALIVIFLGLSLCTRFLAHHWSGDYRMMIVDAMNNPDSIRANFRAGEILKYYALISGPGEQREDYKLQAFKYYERISQLDKQNLSGDLGRLVLHLQLQESPPDSLVNTVIASMRTSQISWPEVRLVQAIIRCVIERGCTLKEESYLDIISSLIVNEKILSGFLREILIDHAEYLATIRGDIDGAISTIATAYMVHQNQDDLLLLSQYYEEAGYYEKMRYTLDELEKNDSFGQYEIFINDARKRLP